MDDTANGIWEALGETPPGGKPDQGFKQGPRWDTPETILAAAVDRLTSALREMGRNPRWLDGDPRGRASSDPATDETDDGRWSPVARDFKARLTRRTTSRANGRR